MGNKKVRRPVKILLTLVTVITVLSIVWLVREYLADRALIAEYAKRVEGQDLPAFFLAIQEGDIPAVRAFLRRDSSLIELNDGRSAIHVAVQSDSIELLKLIAESGIDIDLQNGFGSTALMMAVIGGDHDMLRYLLEKNADADLRNDNGRTALHLAIQSNDLEAVKLLVKHGANPNIADNIGITALDYSEKFPEINALLSSPDALGK